MIMKKILAAVLAVCVVLAAGSAFAQPFRQPQRKVSAQYAPCWCGRGPAGFDRGSREQGTFDDRNNRAQRPERNKLHFAPDMPQEIREKVAEVAKLKIDLEEALTSKPINKAKALEVHAKIQKLNQEIEAWRFEKHLDKIEQFRTQQELNRKFKPQPPAPKPDEAPDAPDEE